MFRSSTQFSAAAYRTQLFNPDDLDNVRKVQAGCEVNAFRLSETTVHGCESAIDFPKIDKELVKTNFFEYLDFALRVSAAQENEKEIRAQLARIFGVRARQDLRLHRTCSPERTGPRSALGMKDGEAKVTDAGRRQRRPARSTAGGSASLTSATVRSSTATGCCALPGAKGGIYGNDAAEATYPARRSRSADGRSPRRQPRHNYTLTFPSGAVCRR